ncbi:MAG TPA: sulfatase [Dehalococcoidia bacterium]|nr:sulfatase [Dehalococcoidia bacterium]
MILVLVAAFALFIGLCSSSSKPEENVAAGEDHPNIIFILTDDQDTASFAYMPNVQSLLVQQGMTFDNFFINDSLCCPSRTSILRGQYVHNTGIFDNQLPDGGFTKVYQDKLEEAMVPVWLHDAGYRTALVGKYLNQYPSGADANYIPPGWSDWQAVITPNRFYDYFLTENGERVHYGDTPEEYSTDVFARKAVDFIKDAGAKGDAFFLYLAFNAPHGPLRAAPRHEGMYANAQAPRPPNFNEADVSDKPDYVKNLRLAGTGNIDQNWQRRLEALQSVDDAVGAIIAALTETGQLDNTYIFLTSDNGWVLGAHRLSHVKRVPYEDSIHVPLYVRGPGVPAGSHDTHLVNNIDLAPTWAGLAGIVRPDLDGRALGPRLLKGQDDSSWRKLALIQQGAVSDDELDGNPPDLPPYQALRTDQWLYVEYATGERELYDMKADPFQLDNIASTQKDVVAKLSARLNELKSCKGQSCRDIEAKPP